MFIRYYVCLPIFRFACKKTELTQNIEKEKKKSNEYKKQSEKQIVSIEAHCLSSGTKKHTPHGTVLQTK